MFQAAASYIERQFKQTLRNRNILIEYDASEKYIDLLFCPATSITSVTYNTNDPDGSGTYVENTDFTTYGLINSRSRSLVLDFNKTYAIPM